MVELAIGTWRIIIRRIPPEPRELVSMYDRAAWYWHSIVGLLGYSRAYTKLFNKVAADGWLRNLQHRAKVLDCGIGTGAFSMGLAQTLPHVPEIHGMDIAPRMLARARDNLQRLGRASVTAQLHCGDMHCLPYPDGIFDMVMCAHLLEHTPNGLQAIEEMVRVLKPGAPLLIVIARVNRSNAWHGLRWRYRSIESRRLQRWMEQAGLGDVRRYVLGSGLSLPRLLSEAYIGRKVT